MDIQSLKTLYEKTVNDGRREAAVPVEDLRLLIDLAEQEQPKAVPGTSVIDNTEVETIFGYFKGILKGSKNLTEEEIDADIRQVIWWYWKGKSHEPKATTLKPRIIAEIITNRIYEYTKYINFEEICCAVESTLSEYISEE